MPQPWTLWLILNAAALPVEAAALSGFFDFVTL
jgi:hypothetical protein